jgi:tRNA A-37 threonylcarbamoyl transferase component Bud32
LARGLEGLKLVVDLTGVALITGLFVIFGLQFRHPAKWDNYAAVSQLRKQLDPPLAAVASSLDLAWPAEKPSLLPLMLAVGVFMTRALLSHSLGRAAETLGALGAKRSKLKKRREPPPPAPPLPAPSAPAPTPVAVAVTPPPEPQAPAAPTAASAPAPAPPEPAPPPAAAVEPTPAPTVLGGTSLSDFLHFDPGPGDAGNARGRGERTPGRTPNPRFARTPRDGSGDAHAGRELPTAAREPVPVFGRYELIEELGRGGMGVVYKARDPKIGRVVAIKSILASHDDHETIEEYERRFRREILAVGKLSHPAIVTVYDFIEDHLGRPAMVMEYVEGETLQQLATRQRPALLRSLEITIQAAEALEHAHASGIIHRDVKPANILIGRDGRARVSDFGIAKVGGMTMTGTQGRLMGTPPYMSPEQFLARTVDGRSDVFSLSSILYWLCTGQRPFEADNLASLAYQITQLAPPAACSRNPELPKEIDVILTRGLAKEPGDRYQRAFDLAEDLKALRDGSPLPSLGANGPTTLVNEATVLEAVNDVPGLRPRDQAKS